MLIVPTSADTAIVLGMDAGWMLMETVMNAAAFVLLAAFAYCCWEMLISLSGKDRPKRSRWAWLAVTGVLFISATIGVGLIVGPVTFNAGQADWVSTSWGYVIGQYSLLAFEVCALVLLMLRILDAIRAGRTGHVSYALWRLPVLLVMMAYGLVLALDELQIYGFALQNTVYVTSFVLAVVGVGSLIATAAIGRMRANGVRESTGA